MGLGTVNILPAASFDATDQMSPIRAAVPLASGLAGAWPGASPLRAGQARARPRPHRHHFASLYERGACWRRNAWRWVTQRPPDVISGRSATRCSATRIAFATIVRVGFTLPLVGCKEESQTTTRLLPHSRP